MGHAGCPGITARIRHSGRQAVHTAPDTAGKGKKGRRQKTHPPRRRPEKKTSSGKTETETDRSETAALLSRPAASRDEVRSHSTVCREQRRLSLRERASFRGVNSDLVLQRLVATYWCRVNDE